MIEASIIIVTYGQWQLTEQCLNSLVGALGDKLGATWEIVVVDNNSADETPERLREWSDRIRVELLSENRNFAGGCNVGAALAEGEVLIFLNNDTEVPEAALETLVEQVSEPGVAAAGCRLLFPDGTVQHAGVAFIRSEPHGGVAFGQHVFHHQDQELAATRACYETDCVTGACLAVSADAFQEVGGFDEAYVNGLEDVDLCLKLRAAGHLIVYRGDVTLIHHEGASRGKGEGLWDTPEKLAMMRHNDEVYVSRWGRFVDQDDELAAAVWGAVLENDGRLAPEGRVSLAVVGQPFGIGSSADEARAMLSMFSDSGQPAAAVNLPGSAVGSPLSDRMKALMDRSKSFSVEGGVALYVPGGRSDRFGGSAMSRYAIVRLAQAETALDLQATHRVWAASPTVMSDLTARGLNPSQIRVIAPPVAPIGVGDGGAGLLAILPTHDRPLAATVLKALQSLPADSAIRLLPTAFVRGWQEAARATLPHAEPLTPCADEERFAELASTADVVLAADPSDHYERRALVAASVGATPVTLRQHGPAAAVLGEDTASAPNTLADNLTARLREPRPRATLAALATASRDSIVGIAQ